MKRVHQGPPPHALSQQKVVITLVSLSSPFHPHPPRPPCAPLTDNSSRRQQRHSRQAATRSSSAAAAAAAAMRPQNQPHPLNNGGNNHGLLLGGYRRYTGKFVVALLLSCLGLVAYFAAPQLGDCGSPRFHVRREAAAAAGGHPLAPAATAAAAAAASPFLTHSSGGAGAQLFAPLLSSLLPLTNFSLLPAAPLLDGGLAAGLGPQQLREMVQLQQQMFCEAGYDKQPLPGSVGVRFQNVTLYVYGSNDIVSSNLATSHNWESSEMQEFLWAIRQWRLPAASQAGDKQQRTPLTVDVGANIGWFTLNAAAAGARVAAFEAMPSNLALLRRSLCAAPWLSERTALYGVGLAEANSSCSIISGHGNRGDGFVVCDRHRAETTQGYSLRGVISLRRLDTLLGPDEDVQVLKIDVEGYEQKALEGARALLEARRVRFIMAECNVGIIGPQAGRDFIRFLDAAGYEVSPAGFKGPFWSGEQARSNASCSNINLFARLREQAR